MYLTFESDKSCLTLQEHAVHLVELSLKIYLSTTREHPHGSTGEREGGEGESEREERERGGGREEGGSC